MIPVSVGSEKTKFKLVKIDPDNDFVDVQICETKLTHDGSTAKDRLNCRSIRAN